jgi:predicted  nucleic acid-binding Zn-ribbon protein
MIPAMEADMRAIVENLYTQQQMLLQPKPASKEQTACIQQLREKVPVQILGHFDRLIAQGRRGVALVRHGICGECHLRISSGTAASLVQPKDVYVCDNCGRYLLLAPDETITLAEPVAPVPPPVRKTRKKLVAAAV